MDDFRNSSNPLLAQGVFSRVKANLLEAGETFLDELILDNTNRVIKLKKNKDKTEDELVEITIKRVRKNKKHLINTKAIEHNDVVRTSQIETVDLGQF